MKKLKLQQLDRLTVEAYTQSTKIPIVVVLDNIRSAMNVGSVFRTSDAFRVEKLYLTGITATPPHREITKTAIGATKSVEWIYQSDVEVCIRDLKDQGYTIIGIEQTDEAIPLTEARIKPDQPIAIVFGNEVNGLSDQILPLLDMSIEIKQYGTKHSLNVSVCAGICLWTLSRGFVASIE